MALSLRFFVVFCLYILSTHANVVDSIGVVDARKIVESNKAVFLDVREPEETKLGFIKNAIVLPHSLMKSDRQLFNKEIRKIPNDMTIIVYCASGRRSGIVAKELVVMGRKVFNMGKFSDWKNAGFSVDYKE